MLDEPFTAIDVNGIGAPHPADGGAHGAQGGMVILTTPAAAGAADTVRRLALDRRGTETYDVACLLSPEAARGVRTARTSPARCGLLMVITLFPLSVGPQPRLLARIAPRHHPVAALLAKASRCWRWSGFVSRRPAGRQLPGGS